MQKQKKVIIDQEVLEGFKRGDTKSFNAIYKRYSEPIKFFILRKVGDDELTKDLAIEVFEKAHAKSHQYDTSKNFTTWLYTIATRHVIDHLRKYSQHEVLRLEKLKGSTDENGDDLEFQLESSNKNPEEEFQQKEKLNFANEIIDSLEVPLMAEIIRLRFMEDLSYDDVAKIVDKPIGTVKSHIHRALKELTEKYGESDELKTIMLN